MTMRAFATLAALALALWFVLPKVVPNPYFFYAGYVVMQYVVIATAWNILGGYAGYINFGASAFFGAGVYTAAALFKAFGASIVIQMMSAALLGVIAGVGLGYLTLRLQGVYFAIGTLALVIVFETIVMGSEYLGGARGLPILAPAPPAWFGGQTQFAFFAISTLAIVSIVLARWIERSWVGRGLRAIRASEEAAECSGVPTLRLKLLACAISGGLLTAAGAPYPLYAAFVEPVSAFSLSIGLNALAMPLIGGTRSWLGPVIGAFLLGTAQQFTTVTISSELNLFVLGVVLIAFVAIAPGGIVGMVQRFRPREVRA
jgi:branched-chain amino acid transport system permease protein